MNNELLVILLMNNTLPFNRKPSDYRLTMDISCNVNRHFEFEATILILMGNVQLGEIATFSGFRRRVKLFEPYAEVLNNDDIGVKYRSNRAFAANQPNATSCYRRHTDGDAILQVRRKIISDLCDESRIVVINATRDRTSEDLRVCMHFNWRLFVTWKTMRNSSNQKRICCHESHRSRTRLGSIHRTFIWL